MTNAGQSPRGLSERIAFASRNTLRGLTFALHSEQAFRHEVVLLALALPVGIVIAPSPGWYVAMIGVLALVLAAELLNTAIEKLADHVTADRHPQIAVVKDCGSAAVGILLALAGLVWLAALFVRLTG
ncbi:MAG: diacylglycerol kinase [Pseudorhodoplanes sp.]|nr:diacylglycerol kinase [Pseudorhodoplanes sp.]